MTFYIGQTFNGYPPPEAIVWVNSHNCKLEQNSDIYTIVENTKPIPTVEEILKGYEDAVQKHLDEMAQSRGYDNSYTCVSYVNSTNEVWNKESNAFNAWRDAVWGKCHELLDAYKAGKIEAMTVEELIEQLPKIEW